MNKQKSKDFNPDLRFPVFLGKNSWKMKPLGKAFSNRQDKGFPDLPLLSLTDKKGIIPQEETNRKNNSKSDKSKYLRICLGDVAYNTMRMWEGRSAYVNIEGLVSPAYTVCKPKLDSNGLFYSYYFKTDFLIQKFRRFSQGLVNDTLSLKYDAFSKIEVPILADLVEQKKIADCLLSIDESITIENQKLEAYTAHRLGLMQLLFPTDGETEPKLRFFADKTTVDWREGELNDLCSMQAGKFVRAADIIKKQDNELYPCYGGNGLRGYTKTYTHEGKYSLIGRQGALCGNVTIVQDKFHATEHAVVVAPHKGVITDWLYYKLIHLNLNQFATGQAQPGLSVENLKKVPISLPTSEHEQRKIADCLSSITKLITAQEKKVVLLKQHKKGLLQKLFPNMHEEGL